MIDVLHELQPLVPVAQAVTAIIGLGTLIVGVMTLWKSILEYRRGNALKSFDKFQEMRKRFEENPSLKEVCRCIVSGGKDLERLDYRMKEDFLGFYEEIALMNQSGLLNDGVAHYMFGYYALRAYENPGFGSNVNLDSTYWSLFNVFCDKMKIIEGDMIKCPNRYRKKARTLSF